MAFEKDWTVAGCCFKVHQILRMTFLTISLTRLTTFLKAEQVFLHLDYKTTSAKSKMAKLNLQKVKINSN